VPVLVLVLLAAAPSLANACPVCFDPRDENRAAFLATTAFMSLLPLGMVAALGLWLRHRIRSQRAADADTGTPPAN
jgi:hypothetical protein